MACLDLVDEKQNRDNLRSQLKKKLERERSVNNMGKVIEKIKLTNIFEWVARRPCLRATVIAIGSIPLHLPASGFPAPGDPKSDSPRR
jgi:hypothetical protein